MAPLKTDPGWRTLAAVLVALACASLGAETAPTSISLDPIAEFLTKGGPYASVMVILFFYRRDYKTVVDFWKDQSKAMSDLTKQSTSAQVETAAAMRELTNVIHSLKRVIEDDYAQNLKDLASRAFHKGDPHDVSLR